MRPRLVLVAALALILTPAGPADAYVGPGAGFALLSSFLVMATTLVLAFAALLSWPFRVLWRVAARARRPRALVRRLIVIGFDGQDPALTDRFIAQGRLPHFEKLGALGSRSTLRTTCPPVSPVAWSSFSTGTSPAHHNIFDFVTRDPRTYLPVLSSARLGKVTRFLRLGRFRVPLHRPELRRLRKSTSFWTLLGNRGIWSTILRVPITFPPERFHGAQLSAMAVPDLLGTQGTFTWFTTRSSDAGAPLDGRHVGVRFHGEVAEATIVGPENVLVDGSPPMTLPLRIERHSSSGRVTVRVGRETVPLTVGVLSGWVALGFDAAPGVAVRGLCRLLVTELEPDFSLYMTPIGIDPEKPAMPISHPEYYATYLAARIGPYSTLGLAEDTGALNEGVIGEAAFLQQTIDIDAERQAMFFAALDRLREGLLVCVFDATDRIQHMFWRDIDAGHPAARGRTRAPEGNAIEAIYARNDALLGEVMGRLRDDDVLMVVSDHGFTSFRRSVNLNGWLRQHGYLVLEDGADGTADWHRDVDWSRTRAYGLGLTSLFLNVRGREAAGIVSPGAEAAALKREIAGALSGLVDAGTGEPAVAGVFDPATTDRGPYLENAPDLILGYNAGYRVSWGSARGRAAGPLIEDNVKPWSGDHSVDPRLVPGVFFCNRRIAVEDPALVDIAPTALTLFGLEPPSYMQGRPLFRRAEAGAA